MRAQDKKTARRPDACRDFRGRQSLDFLARKLFCGPLELRSCDEPSYTFEMSTVIKVPFAHLVFLHHEIGCHRDRQWGFRVVFGFSTLQKLPFLHLATKIKRAYEGKDVPSHAGWPAQREAIHWLVERGCDGIYALDANGIKLRATPFRSYYIIDGNHRALALYILGESLVRARLKN